MRLWIEEDRPTVQGFRGREVANAGMFKSIYDDMVEQVASLDEQQA